MDIYLQQCHLEIGILDQPSLESAVETVNSLRVGLYISGVSPFILPFSTSHSINVYSGINSRDSDLLINKLPEGMRSGPKSNDISFEAWPIELTLSNLTLSNKIGLNYQQFWDAASKAIVLNKLKQQNKVLRTLENIIIVAPQLNSIDQSVLHLWCGIESLFPSIKTEITFKISLYLTQLISNGNRKATYDKIKRMYNVRSRIVHGDNKEISFAEWQDVWNIFIEAFCALCRRNCVPNENDLLEEILADLQLREGSGA